MKILPVLLAIGTVAATGVNAQFTEVDISSDINANIQTYSGGNNYQVGNSTLTVAGVPFYLAEDGGPGTTGVVQAPGGDSSFTFNVPAGTYATTLYTLMNTAFGQEGEIEGTITVTGTLGETAMLTLTEGDNIRDHFNDGYVNSLTDPTVVPTYFSGGAPAPSGSDRLDRQVLDLPASFDGDTIASITFDGINGGNPHGEAFLAGMTLAVPDGPVPFFMTAGLISGLLFLAKSLRQKTS